LRWAGRSPLSAGPKNGAGWAAPWTLGLLALGAVAFAVFLVVERKVSHPLVDLDVMRRRNVWAANLVTLLATTGHGVMFFLVPQIVQLPKSSGVGLGVDVDHSGLFLLPGAVLLIFAGPLTGRLVARFGTRLPLALGVALGCAGLVILAAGSSQPVALLTGGAVLGLAGGVTYATLPMLIADSVPLTDLGERQRSQHHRAPRVHGGLRPTGGGPRGLQHPRKLPVPAVVGVHSQLRRGRGPGCPGPHPHRSTASATDRRARSGGGA